jgi:hypothetical protein
MAENSLALLPRFFESPFPNSQNSKKHYQEYKRSLDIDE